ncbi:hypothetical protein D920_02464 [Enterococcus faecalis 13-SD-W-01]|jgi:hypothetical protein|nr:hypothetical protein D920_02464 [Enterococcus faecalis 13-SD-W-01]
MKEHFVYLLTEKNTGILLFLPFIKILATNQLRCLCFDKKRLPLQNDNTA